MKTVVASRQISISSTRLMRRRPSSAVIAIRQAEGPQVKSVVCR
jgi:hypothetical protein